MRTGGLDRPWLVIGRLLMALAVPAALSSCLIVVSTTPTPVEDATVVFIVRDDGGAFVARVHVTVTAVSGDWGADGFTDRDGAYRCRVTPGVRRVRVSVDPPAGFEPAPDWPRAFDVPSIQAPIDVRVSRVR